MLGAPTTAPNAAAPAHRGRPGPAGLRRQRPRVRAPQHAVQRPAGDPGRRGEPAAPSLLARALDRGTPLPVPLALGVRDLLARRQRALRLAAAIAVTGSAVVFALSMKAIARRGGRPARPATSPTSSRPSSTSSTPCCSLLTLTALVAVALLSVREHIRDYGVLKAIGLTPAQLAVEADERPRRAGGGRGAARDPARASGSTSSCTASPAGPARISSSPRGGGSRSSRSRRLLMAVARHQPPGPTGDPDPGGRGAALRVTTRPPSAPRAGSGGSARGR